jgi:hypothetical protein
MKLWADGPPNDLESLREAEAAALESAGSEGLDIEAKLKQAHEQISSEITMFLVREGRAEGSCSEALAGMLVTEPLRRWHRMKTLELLYREAQHTVMNDRYEQKWKEYERQAGIAAATLLESGVAFAVAVPAATELVSELAGYGGVAAQYRVAVRLVDSAGNEGPRSNELGLDASNGELWAVRLSGAGNGAAGWNVYAGADSDALAKRNAEPLLLEESWVVPVDGLPVALPDGAGCAASYYVRRQPRLRRG